MGSGSCFLSNFPCNSDPPIGYCGLNPNLSASLFVKYLGADLVPPDLQNSKSSSKISTPNKKFI